MKTVIKVRNDQGFGGYYGNLRRWADVKRSDLQWLDQDLPNAAEPELDDRVDEYTTRGELEARRIIHRNNLRAAEYY